MHILIFMHLPVGDYPEDAASVIWKYIFIRLFNTALFVIVKYCKQPKYPYVREWLKKLWYSCTMEHYAAVKKN